MEDTRAVRRDSNGLEERAVSGQVNASCRLGNPHMMKGWSPWEKAGLAIRQG